LATHTCAPASQKCPGSHVAISKHALSAADPVVSENLPAPHSTHVLAADTTANVEYVPVSHGTHALAVSARSRVPNVPGWQSVHTLEPGPANTPPGHAAHAPEGSSAPLAFLNTTPPHGTHGPPSGPMWPSRIQLSGSISRMH